MIFGHMIIQTGFLHERLPAHFAHFPPVTGVYPLVEVQSSLPQECLPTISTVVILNRLMFKLVFVHALEAKGLVLTLFALIFLSQHVEVVYMFP